MSIYKRDGSPFYWVEFEYKGRRVRRSSGTESLRKAEEYERQLRRGLHDQVVMGNQVASVMTLGEAVERYITTHLKTKKRRVKTVNNDAFLLDRMIDRLGGEDITLDCLTTPFITEFKGRLLAAEGLSPATTNRYLSMLKAILRKAHREWEVLPTVPLIVLLPLNNERTRWLTLDEEKALLAACERVPHLRNLVIFLLDTGARLSEATGLTWANVDLDKKPRGSVRFTETKSGKPRSVPLTARTHELLAELHGERPAGQPRVFLRRLPGCGFRHTKPQIKPFHNPHGAWYTAVEAAGLNDVVIHDLRHTFASRLVQKGVPLMTVSKLLGHASLKMSMRYAHLAPNNLDDAISALDSPRQPDAAAPQNPQGEDKAA